MSQIKKLDNLIVKILKEELDELTVASKDGTLKGVTDPAARTQAQNALRKGKAVDFVDPTKMQEEDSEEKEQLESIPTGTDIAGQVAEIVDKLKAMSEGSEDPKKQKLAEKIMKQMESAKAALEALTAHETMLAEKEEQNQLKLAEKNLKGFKRHLGKMVKEPSIVEKIASKLNPKKIVELKKRLKKDLDEEGLAKTMLSYSLQEGWIK